MSEAKVGVFGGTFDPIHNGHLEVARAVVANFALDELLIVPAHRPPHKNARPISGSFHRYAMAVLATMDDDRIIVSTIELDAPERPYTYQTLESLRERRGPGTRLFCLIGGDSFEEVHQWREPERILSAANLVVACRPGYSLSTAHLPAGFRASLTDLRSNGGAVRPEVDLVNPAGGVYLTDYVESEVSSTAIRRKARDGEAIEGMVPPRLADYIRRYDLYERNRDES